jgi:hypothetical protein
MLDYDDFVATLPIEPPSVTGTLKQLSRDSQDLARTWKFHDVYHQSLDMDVLMRLLGDVEFQLSTLRTLLLPLGGMEREQILERNAEELMERFAAEQRGEA